MCQGSLAECLLGGTLEPPGISCSMAQAQALRGGRLKHKGRKLAGYVMMEKWKPPLKREASSNSGFFIETSQLVDFSISFKTIVKNTVGKTNKSAGVN